MAIITKKIDTKNIEQFVTDDGVILKHRTALTLRERSYLQNIMVQDFTYYVSRMFALCIKDIEGIQYDDGSKFKIELGYDDSGFEVIKESFMDEIPDKVITDFYKFIDKDNIVIKGFENHAVATARGE